MRTEAIEAIGAQGLNAFLNTDIISQIFVFTIYILLHRLFSSVIVHLLRASI